MEFITKDNLRQFKNLRALTRHYSKSFYLSNLMLPRDKRWATFALYGYCRHIDNLIDTPRPRTEAELQNELQFLESELFTAYRTGESQHPVIGPFIEVAKAYGIPVSYPAELIKGVRMDIQTPRYETFDDLYLFCYRVAGVVGLMMTPVLGTHDPQALKFAEKLGVAMQLTNILRDIWEDKEMNRVYLPQEEIRSFGLDVNHIFEERMSDNFRRFMKFQIDRAHQYYEEADQGIKMLPREAQYAIYSASKIYRGILRKIEVQDYNPFLGRVYVPMRKKMQIILYEVLRTRIFTAEPSLQQQ